MCPASSRDAIPTVHLPCLTAAVGGLIGHFAVPFRFEGCRQVFWTKERRCGTSHTPSNTDNEQGDATMGGWIVENGLIKGVRLDQLRCSDREGGSAGEPLPAPPVTALIPETSHSHARPVLVASTHFAKPWKQLVRPREGTAVCSWPSRPDPNLPIPSVSPPETLILFVIFWRMGDAEALAAARCSDESRGLGGCAKHVGEEPALATASHQEHPPDVRRHAASGLCTSGRC